MLLIFGFFFISYSLSLDIVTYNLKMVEFILTCDKISYTNKNPRLLISENMTNAIVKLLKLSFFFFFLTVQEN